MIKCKTHHKYKAIKPPKVLCKDCWAGYLGMCEMCVNCGCQNVEYCDEDCKLEDVCGPQL